MTPTRPASAARCSGVTPVVVVRALTSAPALSSASTRGTLPLWLAGLVYFFFGGDFFGRDFFYFFFGGDFFGRDLYCDLFGDPILCNLLDEGHINYRVRKYSN